VLTAVECPAQGSQQMSSTRCKTAYWQLGTIGSLERDLVS
jgi:hypothetical protein